MKYNFVLDEEAHYQSNPMKIYLLYQYCEKQRCFAKLQLLWLMDHERTQNYF